MAIKYQQGDVLLVKVDESERSYLESNCKIETGGDKKGKVILAFGEATGHHHRFELNEIGSGVTISTVYDKIGRYGRWTYRNEPTYYILDGGEATLYHEEHKPLTLPPGIYRRSIVREFDHIGNSTRAVVD